MSHCEFVELGFKTSHSASSLCALIKKLCLGSWLAQSTEHGTLNLRIKSSSPTMGMKPALRKKKKKVIKKSHWFVGRT